MAKLGQHFLVNKNAAEKIANAFFPVTGPILEIGPGKGILTDLLLSHRQNNPIIAVELDLALSESLASGHADTPGFEVLNRDILKTDIAALFPEAGQAVNVAGNIPYYISKEIMDRVIAYHERIGTGIFLVQREFAAKLLVSESGCFVNAQAVILNRLFTVRKCFDIQPGSFSPPPKVKSSVFTIRRKDSSAHPDMDIPAFYRFVKRCFQNRRKTVLNNLSKEPGGQRFPALFERLGIDARARAEELTLEQFQRIFTSSLK
jgi:16S rRNA (adenine1518-N6/adenine1519-N6)-dimethyltransferase